MISFNTIPNNIRIPFVGVEIDNSDAVRGPSLLALRALIWAQKIASGTATSGVPVQVTGKDEAGGYLGRKAGGFGQAEKWFANAPGIETWLMPLSDNGAGVAAQGTIVFSGTATAAGTVHLYMGDRYVPVGCPKNTTGSALGALVAAELNASDAPLGTVVNTTGSLAVPYANKGEVGNSFPMSLNHQLGQTLPPGITCTITQMSGGTTNPSLDTPIANLGDEWFQTWNHPFVDATSLIALETELASRFSGTRMLDGLAITGAGGSFGTLQSLGLTRNSQHSVIMASPGGVPVTPPNELGAAVAARMTFHGMIDPARPFQTLPLTGCRQPKVQFKEFDERNLLLFAGIGTTKNAPGGIVQIDRPITTYRKNAANADDVSYLDSTTMMTLAYLRYSFRQTILLRYPRHKLADTGTPIPAGQAIVTPGIIGATALDWFDDMVSLGLVENRKLFEDNMRVERNADRNRVDVLLPPDLINQLVVTAAKIAFRL